MSVCTRVCRFDLSCVVVALSGVASVCFVACVASGLTSAVRWSLGSEPVEGVAEASAVLLAVGCVCFIIAFALDATDAFWGDIGVEEEVDEEENVDNK